MVIIRREQQKALEQFVLRNFEDEMIQHIKQFAPKHSEIIGEDGLRQVVRMGIERAKVYGLTNRGPVRFYIEMMFMLGSDFDTDPQYPWAGEILKDPVNADQMGRADHLYDKTRDYLAKVAGPKNKYALYALKNVRSVLAQGPFEPGPRLDEDLLSRLKSIYPEKCGYLGDRVLRTLIAHGAEKARALSLNTDQGIILFAGLMFALGHGFATDPQFPWISGTINNPAIESPEKRVERLREKSLTYLDNVLVYLGRG
jgi:hypothetical protein